MQFVTTGRDRRSVTWAKSEYQPISLQLAGRFWNLVALHLFVLKLESAQNLSCGLTRIPPAIQRLHKLTANKQRHQNVDRAGRGLRHRRSFGPIRKAILQDGFQRRQLPRQPEGFRGNLSQLSKSWRRL